MSNWNSAKSSFICDCKRCNEDENFNEDEKRVREAFIRICKARENALGSAYNKSDIKVCGEGGLSFSEQMRLMGIYEFNPRAYFLLDVIQLLIGCTLSTGNLRDSMTIMKRAEKFLIMSGMAYVDSNCLGCSSSTP